MGRCATNSAVTDPDEVGDLTRPVRWYADARLTEDDAIELARVLSALSDPVRLRLMSLVASQGEVCSHDLEKPLRRSQPTISHHTKVLADIGLLIGERRGRWMWWRINPDGLTVIRDALSALG
jgi:ArsR family transcriptional regulator